MEPNQNKQQGIEKLQNQSLSSTTYDEFKIEVAKTIGESIYLLGYNGPKESVITMAHKIVELYVPFEIEILKDIMEDFMTGERKFQYQINMSNITEALKDKRVMTKKQKEIYDKTGIDWTNMVM